jgi:hypothetical protein
MTTEAPGPRDGGKAAQDWTALSARQRDLLRKAFDADQAAEKRERQRARGKQAETKALWPESRPADAWRRLSLDQARGRLRPRDTDGADYEALRNAGLIEAGACAWVRMTRAGRAAVRAGTGAPAPGRLPRGLLSRWSWAALAELAAAGDGGLVIWHSTRRVHLAEWEKCPSWNTILRLKNRSAPYAEEFQAEADGWCVRLTAAGREHVEANRGHYTARYPDVDVPGPDHAITRHRADPGQMARDAQHRNAFFELAEAAVAARRSGDPDEAARIGAQADAYRRPSACGHWRSQTMGADCGLRRPASSGG